jgi:hypothetical protein
MAHKLSTHKTDLTLDLEQLEAEYEYYPALAGKRETPGVLLDPDLPEQVEILHLYAKTSSGGRVDILELLSESEIISIEDEILESMRG